jgi:class 3 adenylate cyclase
VADNVRFAPMADGREIAYRVISGGDGPLIVHTPGDLIPIDLLHEDPMYDRFIRTLATAGRLVLYDKPGAASSDPIDPDRNFFDEMTDAYLAVLDALHADAAWIVENRLGANVMLIRSRPDRVLGVVLLLALSQSLFRPVSDAAIARERESEDGMGKLVPSRADDPAFLDWIRRARRLGASATDRAIWYGAQRDAVERSSAEALTAPILDAPPVMLIRRRDAMSLAGLKGWNEIFPDAECVTIGGADLDINGLDAGLIAELAAGFITGTPIEAPAQRQLVAVLFTDLVDSTPTAAASGDTVWRSTLDRYEGALQGIVQRHHGTVVKHTGDGALATFASGSEAIAAAIDLRSTTRDLGLEGRTGIHIGEVEQRGDDIGGIAVHLAARVMGEASPGGIVVTSAVDETTLGGRYQYGDLGTRALKGIERPIHLFTVESDAIR